MTVNWLLIENLKNLSLNINYYIFVHIVVSIYNHNQLFFKRNGGPNQILYLIRLHSILKNYSYLGFVWL